MLLYKSARQGSLCGLGVSHICIILFKIYSCLILYNMFKRLLIMYTYIHTFSVILSNVFLSFLLL